VKREEFDDRLRKFLGVFTEVPRDPSGRFPRDISDTFFFEVEQERWTVEHLDFALRQVTRSSVYGFPRNLTATVLEAGLRYVPPKPAVRPRQERPIDLQYRAIYSLREANQYAIAAQLPTISEPDEWIKAEAPAPGPVVMPKLTFRKRGEGMRSVGYILGGRGRPTLNLRARDVGLVVDTLFLLSDEEWIKTFFSNGPEIVKFYNERKAHAS